MFSFDYLESDPRDENCRKDLWKHTAFSESAVTSFAALTIDEPSATKINHYNYSKSENSTRDVFKSRLAKLDKAVRVLCFTGATASPTLIHLDGTGLKIVAGDNLYGGSDNLLSCLNACNLDIGSCTKPVWLKSSTNPRQQICDIRYSTTKIDPYDYTRSENSTRDVLESLLTKFDKADLAFSLISEMAAVTHLVEIGQKIVVGDDLYGGFNRLLSQVTQKTEIVAKRVTPCKDEDASVIGLCTKFVWLESPTNPLQQICDIHMLEAVIKNIELSTATVGGTVHGGENSGAGGTVEFQTIHVEEEEGDSEPATTIPQDSPSPTSSYDTSVAAHQSDQQPPPGTPTPGTQIEDETLQEQPRFNITFLAKTFMMVSATNGGTIVTSRLSAGNSLSENDKILLASAVAFSTAGFLLCFGGSILDSRRRAKLAALLTGIGGVAAIFGFILTMSTIF